MGASSKCTRYRGTQLPASIYRPYERDSEKNNSSGNCILPGREIEMKKAIKGRGQVGTFWTNANWIQNPLRSFFPTSFICILQPSWQNQCYFFSLSYIVPIVCQHLANFVPRRTREIEIIGGTRVEIQQTNKASWKTNYSRALNPGIACF